MTIDITGITYFMPLFVFLFVFAVIFSILNKVKMLGDNQFAHLLISFIISIIFVTTSNTQEYIQTITPWVVVFVVCIFFILMIIATSQQKFELFFKPATVWVLISILIIIFLVSANKVFSNLLLFDTIKDTLNSNARIVSGLLLAVTAALVSWILTKK
jgi:hypothetical protein